MDTLMIGGASIYESEMEPDMLKGFALLSYNVHYQLSPDQASEQFRYFIASNLENHEYLLKFYNLVQDNKVVKESVKFILDSITTNMRIYVPMITPQLTMEESE